MHRPLRDTNLHEPHSYIPNEKCRDKQCCGIPVIPGSTMRRKRKTNETEEKGFWIEMKIKNIFFREGNKNFYNEKIAFLIVHSVSVMAWISSFTQNYSLSVWSDAAAVLFSHMTFFHCVF